MNYSPSYSTYAFEDLTCTLSHPSLGQVSLQGTGIGSISFAMLNDSSAMDNASDGSIMTSKIQARDGTITIETQETSLFHTWMIRAYNYVIDADSSEWAQFEFEGRSPVMHTVHEGKYMSIAKEADKPYQAQGGRVTWVFDAPRLTEKVE